MAVAQWDFWPVWQGCPVAMFFGPVWQGWPMAMGHTREEDHKGGTPEGKGCPSLTTSKPKLSPQAIQGGLQAKL